MNALERFNNQDDNKVTMQKPIETRNGLYIWEQWTYDGDNVSDIRFYSEDVNGGKTFRLGLEDFLKLRK
ncbi:MAG: hypothetical protein GY823_07180 [Flavobacteriaceae bacterium]|nr:hypothetical protein [Flavobacteriaceae bacterium]